ncbi:MAG: polyprenyl synthetase family protein [Actinobacteria bacterium]|nr:polyprenyl synthetase family protein [Actinomycetota bacterium]
MTQLPEIFETYKPYIEKEIKSLLCNTELLNISKRKAALYEMMSYHMGWADETGAKITSNGGKYLRATLTLLSCESICGDFKIALPVAAAIELIHNFSLVHDDIQDDDEIRRHRPTVWKIWGKPQAINVGSAMKTLANLSVINLKKNNIAADKLIEVLKILDESCLRMLEGQFLDIDFEAKPDVNTADYLKMIERKTAALIECALQIGAVTVMDFSKINPFKNFGKYLGLAFQIRDDILGIWGNDKKTGKPSGNDLRKKKKSFPVVYVLSNADSISKQNFLEIYSKDQILDSDIEKILEILNNLNIRKVSETKAQEFYDLALAEIKKLPVKAEKIMHFKEISNFLVNRDF